MRHFLNLAVNAKKERKNSDFDSVFFLFFISNPLMDRSSHQFKKEVFLPIFLFFQVFEIIYCPVVLLYTYSSFQI